ncbi:MAG: hypothetical protein ATN31_03105 [Candidatus Epulonipiscioides saccharophilum]|nr:MAG: hypothetical protein ATN31_03105 [Epulopiscium sp. AS2M-Bin001]
MEINTNRLKLVPINHKFEEDIFNNFTPEVTIYMTPTPAKNIQETRNIISKFLKDWENKTDYVFAITLKDTNEFIGLTGIHAIKSDRPTLGIWTKTSSHGNHYGREAIGGIIKLATILNLPKVFYPVDNRNIASEKIAIFYNGHKLLSDFKESITSDNRLLLLETYEIIL